MTKKSIIYNYMILLKNGYNSTLGGDGNAILEIDHNDVLKDIIVEIQFHVLLMTLVLALILSRT